MSADLLQRIDAFLLEADMPATVFGRAVARDPRLVSDLLKGREAGESLTARADNFMRNWRTAFAAGEAQRVGDRRYRHKPIVMQGNTPSAINAFLGRVDQFLEESGMRPTTLGRKAMGDCAAVANWRKGRNPTFRTMRRVDDFIGGWRREKVKHDRIAAGRAERSPSTGRLLPVSAPLATIAMCEAGSDARKAIELLRIAIESLQPIARAA